MGHGEFSETEIREALTRAGIPDADQAAFVRFQRDHGGQLDAICHNPVVWGLIHRESEYWPSGEIEAEFDAGTGRWDVVCADVHPSDTVSLDQRGRLYWSGFLRFEHYDDYFDGQEPLPWEAK